MRLLTVAFVTSIVSGCYAQDPPANGLDGQLEFGAPTNSAVGASSAITVGRAEGNSQTCVIGKGGDSCEGGSYFNVLIRSASCGDGCTATFSDDAPGIVNVVEARPGDFVLAVSVQDSTGAHTWHDRFPLHAEVATSIAVVSADRQPLGVAYASEVGAKMPLSICLRSTTAPVPAGFDLECLAGDFPQAITSDGVVAVTPSITIANEAGFDPAHQPFAVELRAAGTGHLQVSALGLTASYSLRAAAPSEWQRIELAPFDPSAGNNIDIATAGLVGAPVSALTIDQGNFGTNYMVATAVLADGSRALISATRVSCQPAMRVIAKPLNFTDREALWSSDGVGPWELLIDVPDYTQISPGTATCVVTGYEALGTLAVEVQ